MVKAIEAGIPKMRIEEAAARKQARIDAGVDTIVGVNAYQARKGSPARHSRSRQHAPFARRRSGASKNLRRSATRVKSSAHSRRSPNARGRETGNLLALAVDAARKRATLGEISDALEKVFGRYQAVIHSISGVYSAESQMDKEFQNARLMADEFAKEEGRRPRILVAKMGQDGHDRGAKVISTAFADLGFDVDIGPLFQTPREVARHAVENDVHVLGVSTLAGSHKTLVPLVIEELKTLGREDILVVVGGVIPPQDFQFLYDAGAAGVFGPGTIIPVAAQKILRVLTSTAVEDKVDGVAPPVPH